MFLFCFIGFVQPSPNRGCHFQRGKIGGPRFEHLCGTIAVKGPFLVVLREVNDAGGGFFPLKKAFFFFFFRHLRQLCWLEP